jgi:hypothetical protein
MKPGPKYGTMEPFKSHKLLILRESVFWHCWCTGNYVSLMKVNFLLPQDFFFAEITAETQKKFRADLTSPSTAQKLHLGNHPPDPTLPSARVKTTYTSANPPEVAQNHAFQGFE